jgi:hypothetical protein
LFFFLGGGLAGGKIRAGEYFPARKPSPKKPTATQAIAWLFQNTKLFTLFFLHKFA